MKVTSGMTHPLVGTQVRHLGSPRPAPPAPALAIAHRPVASTRTPRRMRQAAMLSLVTSAALLGCSSVTAPTWRMEPVYRVASAGADPAQGYLALARQYEGEDRSAQALDAYRKAAKAAPDDADVHNATGLALARQAQFGPAVQALRRAVALAPERAPLINNLGYALLLDGRADEARAMLRLALAVDPLHELASRNLAHADAQRAPAVAMAAGSVAQAAAVNGPPVEAAASRPVRGPLVALPVGPPVLSAAAAAAAESASPADPSGWPQTPTAVQRPLSAPRAASPAPGARTDADAGAGAGAGASVAAVPLARVPLDGIRIEIVNGNGVEGVAGRMRLWLRQQGIESGRLANLLPYSSLRTQVQYQRGKLEQAHEVASRLPVQALVAPAPEGSTRADLRVVIGHDARYAVGCAALSACAGSDRIVAVSSAR